MHSSSATGTSTPRRSTATNGRSGRRGGERCAARRGIRDDEAAAEPAGQERATLEESLAALGLDHVDLWLIHWPPGGQARPEVWERLLGLQAQGLARTSASAITAFGNRRARAGDGPAAGGQPDRVGPRAVRLGGSRRASHAEAFSSRATARSGRRTSATRDSSRSRRPQRHTCAGRPALARRASGRRDPEVGEPRPDRRERRRSSTSR